MQPDLLEISSQTTAADRHQSKTATQHGFEFLNSIQAQELRLSTQPVAAGDAAATPADGEGLLPIVNKSVWEYTTPSFQRISEHENALALVTTKNIAGGPGFKIFTKKGSKPGGPQLEEFPNEVLTHILSHLPANSLLVVSLVSRRFYTLVTTPHAWRTAFSRFFPGQDALHEGEAPKSLYGSDQHARDHLRSEQRLFTRLTALASWRSEYILRTRLLRSLARGKPGQVAASSASVRSNNAANSMNAVVTYNSHLFSTINHIHAIFTTGKRSPRFIHGTDDTGMVSSSDPSTRKTDSWGLSDPQSLSQFADIFPGDDPYGLGEGHIIGSPNVMDVSQPFGMVYGEGLPGGRTYFRTAEEMRGRFLACSVDVADAESGVPKIPHLAESICAVWIAKSIAVPKATDGLVGIMTGSSSGVVTAYSLGADTLNNNRLDRGEVTAKWMLSPGVPIIGISIDESYSAHRRTVKRIWAVALNALGEVFYLTEPLQRATIDRGAKLDQRNLAKTAWETGRNTTWSLAEPTRRIAVEDPYNESDYDGSYSPRSSTKSMNLSIDQLVAETHEIEKFVLFPPAHFRKVCQGWDMRRKFEVDFAGDDGNEAGESIVVIMCGEGSIPASVKRFTRLKLEQASLDEYPPAKTPPLAPEKATTASLFGCGIPALPRNVPVDSAPNRPFSLEFQSHSSPLYMDEWRASILSLKDQISAEITTSAIDLSIFAITRAAEDPLMTVNGMSSSSSPLTTPVENGSSYLTNIPGYRARFMAVGTKTGTVLMWDMRGPQSTNPTIINELQPLRIIHTDSPQITCLAVSSLYVVHGGNDGLVQAWDPLASTLQPIRTLNSRFSSRARRRLVQAEASVQGVGINLYAAGAISIDPDPTALRGIVSLGNLLRYWSYSSSTAEQYSGKKRRVRRPSERGHNGGLERFTSTGRGALMDYIATEQEELKMDKERRTREEARLRGRFGVGLGGLNDEEAVRYAEMVSQETFKQDEERRTSDAGHSPDRGQSSSTQSQSVWSSQTVTPEGSLTEQLLSPKFKADERLDQDIEEAIRLSLLDDVEEGGSLHSSGIGGFDIPFIIKSQKGRCSASTSPSASQASKTRTTISSSIEGEIAVNDLALALRLSLAELESHDEFPVLKGPDKAGKGKGKST